MGFGWAYVDCDGSGGSGGGAAEGASGSIAFLTASGTDIKPFGVAAFKYFNGPSVLSLTGSIEVEGSITASNYRIVNVVEMDVAGNTFFGNTDDDEHSRTGSFTMTNVAGQTNFAVNTTGRTDLRTLTVEYTAVESTPYTATRPAYILGVKKSGQVNIQLPTPVGDVYSGSLLIVKDELVTSRGGDNITLTTAAGLIDGAASYILTGSMPAISLYSDGANWFVF